MATQNYQTNKLKRPGYSANASRRLSSQVSWHLIQELFIKFSKRFKKKLLMLVLRTAGQNSQIRTESYREYVKMCELCVISYYLGIKLNTGQYDKID